MDSKAARRLKIGTRVRFSDGVFGTVIETGYNAVKVDWEDGQVGIIHHDDMQEVSRDLSAEMSKSALPGSDTLAARLISEP